MDRHHAIRILTNRLKGTARSRAIDYLLTHPNRINGLLNRRLLRSKGGAANRRSVNLRHDPFMGAGDKPPESHHLHLDPWASRRE